MAIGMATGISFVYMSVYSNDAICSVAELRKNHKAFKGQGRKGKAQGIIEELLALLGPPGSLSTFAPDPPNSPALPP